MSIQPVLINPTYSLDVYHPSHTSTLNACNAHATPFTADVSLFGGFGRAPEGMVEPMVTKLSRHGP